MCCVGSAHVQKCKRFVIPLLKIHFTHRQIHHIATVCFQLQTSCDPKHTMHQPKTINVPLMHCLCLGNSLTVYSTLTQMFKLTFLQNVSIFQRNAFFLLLEFLLSQCQPQLSLVYCTQTWAVTHVLYRDSLHLFSSRQLKADQCMCLCNGQLLLDTYDSLCLTEAR